jgi:DNA-binding transcriptional ArsR family regulator
MITKSTEAQLNHRLLKALSHPLRQRILHALTHRVASPSELAEELDEPLGNVAYHVKILAANDAVELVKTAPVRGALEHFYRATARSHFDDEQWSRMPVSVRRALIGDTLKEIWDAVTAAASENGLAEATDHVSRTHLELDEEAYKELNDLLDSVLDRALVLHAEAAPRLAELPAEERNAHVTELAMLHFHRAARKPQSARTDGRAGARKPKPKAKAAK